MIHIRKNESSFLEIVGNSLIVYSHITDACSEEDNEFLRKLVEDYVLSDCEVGIQVGFNLSTLIDDSIEGHKISDDEGEVIIDIGSKPIFEKTRAELQTLINRIDAMNFK